MMPKKPNGMRARYRAPASLAVLLMEAWTPAVIAQLRFANVEAWRPARPNGVRLVGMKRLAIH